MQLERVIGNTVKTSGALAVSPATGDIAYPAGYTRGAPVGCSCSLARVALLLEFVVLESMASGVPVALLFFFFTLVAGPRRSLGLKLSGTRVYEPQIRARLGTTTHFCEVVVLKFVGLSCSLARVWEDGGSCLLERDELPGVVITMEHGPELCTQHVGPRRRDVRDC